MMHASGRTLQTQHRRTNVPSDVWILAREAGQRWANDACYRLGASLSYYALFSLFPLLLLSVTGVGWSHRWRGYAALWRERRLLGARGVLQFHLEGEARDDVRNLDRRP